uniref:Uncharacterized protein n=1 Tax=Rhizophora mucronata TaxID=61149 RepID=A0A2P2QAX5_RHIMU
MEALIPLNFMTRSF